MARIYYGSFKSIQNITYRVELYDGPSGSTSGGTELILSNNGFKIERQGEGSTYYQDFLRPSRITTFWHIPNNTVKNAFVDIANNEENKFAVVVYRGSDLFYVGRVIADQASYLRESVDGAMIFDLVAVDALNLIEGFNIDPTWFTNNQATALDKIGRAHV